MALSLSTKIHFLESFDYYAAVTNVTNGVTSKWAVGFSGIGVSLEATPLGKLLRMTGTNTPIDRTFTASNRIAGGAFMVFRSLPASSNSPFFTFGSSASNRQFSLNLASDGSLKVVSANNIKATTSAGLITTDVGYYIEMDGVIDNTNGWVKVWVNGTLVIDQGTIDTQEQAGTTASAVRFSSTNLQDIDDIYIATERLGFGRIKTISPNSDVGPNDWTPNTGSNEYDRVNASQPAYNGLTDSTYISSASNNQISMFGLSTFAIPFTDILGAQIVIGARKIATTSASQLRSVASQGVTDINGATHTVAGASTETHYNFYTTPIEIDDLTSLEIGVESIDADPNLRVGFICLEVFVVAENVYLEKLHATATYANTDADSLINLFKVEKLHTTAVYRNLDSGLSDVLLFDKMHVTAVYRFSEGGFESPPPQKRRSVNINIFPWPFTLWGSPVLDAIKDEEYEGFQVTYKNGVAPVLFFLDGEWPLGIAMQPDGMVAGTPTEFGVFPNLSIIGVDGALNESILPVGTITVLEYAPLEISGTPVLEAIKDAPYEGFTATAVGGQGSRTFSLVGTWPAGITVDSTTGVVSGTPTETGTFSDLSVRVDDSDSNTVQLETFSIEVIEALVIEGTPVLIGTEGEVYAGFTVSAEGGVPPYTFSLVGDWPDGITVHPTSGVVSGTPTEPGTFTGLSVEVNDSNLNSDQLETFTIEIEAITSLVLDGLSPTGAWSFSRDLLTAFIGGTRYVETSGAISALNDQSGNARDLTQATAELRPVLATAGPLSRACADFDGSDDRLAGTAISNFIAAGAGYAVVSFLPDAITTNSATAYLNHAILCDGSSQFMGLFLRNTDADVGDPDTIYAYNWDGTVDAASSTSIIVGTAYVVEWKHEGGNVSVRVNGGSWVNVASGNTTSLVGSLTLGTLVGSATTSLNGKIFEAAIFSTVPSSDDQDAIVADFMGHIGI